jgi:hypothetical protein
MSAFTTLLKVLSQGKNPLAGLGAQAKGKILPYSEERILRNIRENAPEILSSKRSGGFSFDPRRGKFIEGGEQIGSFMSSIPNDPTLPVKAGGGVATNIDELINVVSKPEVMSRLRRNEYLGGYNPEGILGLDPANRFLTDLSAIRSGLKTNQAEGFRSLRTDLYPVTEAQKDIARNQVLKNVGITGALGLGSVAAGDYLSDKELDTAGKIALAPLLLGGAALAATRAPSSLKGATTVDFLTGGLAGGIKSTGKSKKLSGSKLDKAAKELVLPDEKEIITTEKIKQGTVNYSKFGQDANKKMQSKIKTVKDDKGKDVESLIYKSLKDYPEEFKSLGFVPIKGYDYIKGGGNQNILKLNQEEVINTMAENIKNAVKLSDIKNDSQFYVKYNKFINDNSDILSPEELANYGSQFSAGASPESEAKAIAAFVKNPYSLPPEGSRTRSTGTAYAKALRAQQFEKPLDVNALDLEGRLIKIGSYAKNKMNPNDPNFVTVDTHAANLALGSLVKKGNGFSLPMLQNEKVYQLFMKAYQKAADDLGMLPSEVQSASWYAWRNIYYNPTRTLEQVLAENKLTNINPIFKKSPQERFENIMDVKRKQLIGEDYTTEEQKKSFLNLALKNPPK